MNTDLTLWRHESRLGELRAALHWQIDEQRRDADFLRPHEAELPVDSEFRGMSAAELAAVDIGRAEIVKHPRPWNIEGAAQRLRELDLARIVAPVRERMAEREKRIAALAAEVGPTATLVANLRRYAGKGTDRVI